MNVALSLLDLAALSPLLILLAGALIVLLMETFAKTERLLAPITFLTLFLAGCAAVQAPASQNPLLTPWLRFDGLAQLFTLLFLGVGMATTLLAIPFFHQFPTSKGEFYFLLLSSVFGLVLIGAAADFLTLFLGLETLSIALYVLCGYMKKWTFSHEAAIKYFLIGSLAAAFLLYGIALVYGAVGTTRLDALLTGYQGLTTDPTRALFLAGIALVTLGLAFKAAIVPFHVWAPDVYDGAPTPVTAFMAVGTKLGAFAALAVVFLKALPQFDPIWNKGISLLAYSTLIYANYVALRQTQLRRFFAYSGIAHAGILLLPFVAGGPQAIPALLFYLVVYALATLAAFAVLARLDRNEEGATLSDLQGLFYRQPLMAAVLSVSVLTLAGIPPTVGFFAKFFVFKEAFQAGYMGLVIVGLLVTILGAYYYLRLVAVMLQEAPDTAHAPLKSSSAAFVGAVTIALLTALSFFPAPLLDWILATRTTP